MHIKRYTLKKYLINLYSNVFCVCILCLFIFMFIKVNEMGLVHLKWSPGDWCSMCWTE